MATLHISQSLNSSIDTAVASTSLNAVATAGYALGGIITNTPTDGTTIGYDMGDLTITLSSAVTTGSGAPNIVVWVLPSVDGTNYPTPPGTTAGAAPLSLSYTFQQLASISTSTIVCPNIPLPPYSFRIQIQNNLGVTLPATNTSTCKLQRKTMASW